MNTPDADLCEQGGNSLDILSLHLLISPGCGKWQGLR